MVDWKTMDREVFMGDVDPNLIETLAAPMGSYHRKGEIELRRNMDCDVCQTKKTIGLYMDSSEGEYGGCSICLSCMEKAVGKLKS